MHPKSQQQSYSRAEVRRQFGLSERELARLGAGVPVASRGILFVLRPHRHPHHRRTARQRLSVAPDRRRPSIRCAASSKGSSSRCRNCASSPTGKRSPCRSRDSAWRPSPARSSSISKPPNWRAVKTLPQRQRAANAAARIGELVSERARPGGVRRPHRGSDRSLPEGGGAESARGRRAGELRHHLLPRPALPRSREVLQGSDHRRSQLSSGASSTWEISTTSRAAWTKRSTTTGAPWR